MKIVIYFFVLCVSSTAFALPEFRLEVGTQACHRGDGIERCEKAIYDSELIHLSHQPYQKMFIANQLSKSFHFQLVLVLREKTDGKGYICRVFLKNAQDGTSLGSYSTDVGSLDELNDIKLGSSQVVVSPTEVYYGWVKLGRATLDSAQLPN